mmetsp:Transcript_162396/g.515950  ORF Transcript_162396/g.515950 Transcript_162396/m.515950 type:complete len:220 (-) Transcript_162396:269-928(-)
MSKVSRRSPTTCKTCKRRCRTFKLPSLAAPSQPPLVMMQSLRPSSRRCRRRPSSRKSCPEALRYRLCQRQHLRHCRPQRRLRRRHRWRLEEVQFAAAVSDSFSCPDRLHGSSSPLCTTTGSLTISSGHCLYSCSDLSVASAQICRSVPFVEIANSSCQPMYHPVGMGCCLASAVLDLVRPLLLEWWSSCHGLPAPVFGASSRACLSERKDGPSQRWSEM